MLPSNTFKLYLVFCIKTTVPGIFTIQASDHLSLNLLETESTEALEGRTRVRRSRVRAALAEQAGEELFRTQYWFSGPGHNVCLVPKAMGAVPALTVTWMLEVFTQLGTVL